MPYCIVLYYTILYYTILYYTILYYTILYYTILYYTIPYHTIPYYTMLYYTILYYTILYYTILYYTMLDRYWRPSNMCTEIAPRSVSDLRFVKTSSGLLKRPQEISPVVWEFAVEGPSYHEPHTPLFASSRSVPVGPLSTPSFSGAKLQRVALRCKALSCCASDLLRWGST